MEIAIILLCFVAGVAVFFAIVTLVAIDLRPALIWTGAAVTAALLAFWLNGQLVERNKVPVSDRMQVTTVTQTYEGNARVYRMSFNNVSYSSAVVCEDGETVKCSELKLGDTIVLKRWKNDGWTWRFSPTQVV